MSVESAAERYIGKCIQRNRRLRFAGGGLPQSRQSTGLVSVRDAVAQLSEEHKLSGHQYLDGRQNARDAEHGKPVLSADAA